MVDDQQKLGQKMLCLVGLIIMVQANNYLNAMIAHYHRHTGAQQDMQMCCLSVVTYTCADE